MQLITIIIFLVKNQATFMFTSCDFITKWAIHVWCKLGEDEASFARFLNSKSCFKIYLTEFTYVIGCITAPAVASSLLKLSCLATPSCPRFEPCRDQFFFKLLIFFFKLSHFQNPIKTSHFEMIFCTLVNKYIYFMIVQKISEKTFIWLNFNQAENDVLNTFQNTF